MTNNQDARPFVDLKKDAEEFREKFDEDIKECLNFLDAQITALICDPDSIRGSASRDVKQNALVDFSKAKYEIFLGVKSLMNQKEREWINYMSEMKKLFVENVEIFLAGTKLEVKLPSDVQFPTSRKSPGNRINELKSIPMARQTIPVLSSPLQIKASQVISNVGSKAQFNRGSSFRSISFNKASFPSTSATVYLNKNTDSSESSANDEAKTVEDKVQSNRSKRLSIKLNEPQNLDDSVFLKGSTDSSENSESEVKIEVQPKRRGRGRQTAISIKLAKPPRVAQENIEMDTDESRPDQSARNQIPDNKPTRITRGRRGKLPAKNVKLDEEMKNGVSEDSGESSASEQIDIHESNNHSDETEEVNVVETSSYQIRGRKGRGARSKLNDLKAVDSTKVLRGKPAVPKSSENSDFANEIVSTKVRRGRPAVQKIPEISDSVVENSKTRRGKPVVSKFSETNGSEKSVPAKRGRRGAKNVNKAAETSDSETTENHRSVTAEAYNFDNYDPDTNNAKSVTKRKSWRETLEEMSGDTIVPTTPIRAISKRKTISGVSELESAIPSKRLKISNRKSMSIASMQVDDNAANDNHLESDGNYSQWIALKSIDGKVSTHPAIYEIKVWRAKKPAYIGCCESLRQKLTLYKLRQNSGHKHLDKFVERNFDDIQVRYELVPSVADAKGEVKSRVDSFIAQYKTTPAYN